MSILFALLAATALGGSDFVGGAASRRAAAITVVLVAYPAAVPVFVVAALLLGGNVDGRIVVAGTLAGIAQGLGVWWLFLALAAGPMSVVAPATALLAAGVPVLAGVALGERPGVLPLLGIAVALAAVVLVSRGVGAGVSRGVAPGVVWLTFGAGLMAGLVLVFLHDVSASGMWPLVFARSAASVVVLVAATCLGSVHLPHGAPLGMAACVAAVDVIANAAMLFALQRSMLSLAGVLIALYPTATVALAIALQGERVSRTQQVGLALGATAIAAIAWGT